MAIKPLADEEEVLETRWKTLCASLDAKISGLKSINATEAMELEQKLASLTLRPRNSIMSPGDTELPIAEYRLLHQKIAAWISGAESKLKVAKPSDKAMQILESEVGENKLKLLNLNEAFKDLSFPPEVLEEVRSGTKNVNDRLEKVVQTLDRYKVLRESSICQPKLDLNFDVEMEEIDTLPEDDESNKQTEEQVVKPSVIASPLKRSENVVISPKPTPDSSSSGTLQASPPRTTFEVSSPENKSRKTYPSPTWFINTKEIKPKPDLTSPERVRVVVNMLPSPQKTQVPMPMTITTEAAAPQPQLPEQATLTPSSTTTTISEQSNQDVIQLENEAIDRILSETDANLAEVIKKSSMTSTPVKIRQEEQNQKDIASYFETVRNLLEKIGRAADKLEDVKTEQDLDLRVDLIEMDLRLLEAEADTLTSRGEHLVLMTQQQSPDVSADLKALHEKLTSSWSKYKEAAEKQRNGIITTSVMLQQYTKAFESIKQFLDENQELKVNAKFVDQVNEKKREVNKIENFAANLRKEHAFKDTEIKHLSLVERWRTFEKRLNSGPKNQVAKTQKMEQQDAQGSPRKVLSHTELTNRIKKLRTAIAAINRQLDSQLLHGKQYESLNLQQKALDTVKNALDKLKPMVRTTEKDFEFLSGSMSIEAVEKLTGVNEKLQSEWTTVNGKFTHRKSLWEESSRTLHGLEDEYKALSTQIKQEKSIPSFVPTHVNNLRGQLIKFLTKGAGLRSKFSTQEATKLQLKMDLLNKHWDEMFDAIVKDDEGSAYIERWLKDALVFVSKPIDGSDRDVLNKVLSTAGIMDREVRLVQDFVNDEGKVAKRFVKMKPDLKAASESVVKVREQSLAKLKRLDRVDALIEQTSSKMSQISKQMDKDNNDVSALTTVVNETSLKMIELQNNCKEISKEVAQSNLKSSLSSKTGPLVERWDKLLSRCATIGVTPHSMNSLKTLDADANVRNAIQSVETIPSTQTSEDVVVSRTTCSNSQSSFYSEEAPNSSDLINDMLEDLQKTLVAMTQDLNGMKLAVHQATGAKDAVRKCQGHLRDLDARKTRLDRYVSDVHDDVLSPLQPKLEKLNESLVDAKKKLLARISECTSMAADSELFGRKYSEISDRLNNPKDSRHHLKVFVEICQRIVKTYKSDDVSKVEQAMNEIKTKFDAKKKEKVAQNPSKKLEILMDDFLVWLSTMENSAREFDEEIRSLKLGGDKVEKKLQELEESIVSMDCEFNMLRSQTDDGKLGQFEKMDEISKRWKALQNQMLNLKSRTTRSSSSESSVDEASVALDDIKAWIVAQNANLDSIPSTDNVETLKERADSLARLSKAIDTRIGRTQELKKDFVAKKKAAEIQVKDASETISYLQSLNERVDGLKSEIEKELEVRATFDVCARGLNQK